MLTNSDNNQQKSIEISKQNGNLYLPLNVQLNDNLGPISNRNHPARSKTFKYDAIPEVKFCHISIENLYGTSQLLDGVELNANNSSSNEGNLTAINISTGNRNGFQNNLKCLTLNESGDSIESGSSDKKKSVIPDGGYGWVVVFASVVISLIADGLSFSFGLINTELLAYFGESTSKTAWISSLFFSVPLLMGPIWSNLVDKYGCRKMTMIGGLISGIGFGLSSICNSIEMLMITFGVISGLGLGIGYVTAVVSIAFWFDKKRTFATGIGASGTGIGTFLYAPITQWLIDSYGWRGATLILAGTMFNTCVCGALMRDPDWLIEENRLESRSQSVTTFSNSSVCLDEIKKLLDTGATKEYVLDTLVTKNNTEANQQIEDPNKSHMKRYRSEIFLPTYLGFQELEDVYDVKSISRRSLRDKDGAEAPSRENLLSMSSAGPASTTAAVIGSPDDTIMGGMSDEVAERRARAFLASMETLSYSEKFDYRNDSTQFSGKAYMNSFEGHLPGKYSAQNPTNRIISSRFSLNENVFLCHQNQMKTIKDLKVKKYRYNSVDILNPNVNSYYTSIKDDRIALIEPKLQKSNVILCANGNTDNNDGEHAVINMKDGSIQNTQNFSMFTKRLRTDSITGLRGFTKFKKPNYRSNLRRNISIRNSNFLKDIKIHRNSIHYRGAMLNTHRYRLRASSCPNIYRNSMTTIAKDDQDTWYENLMDTMKSIFDFSLFADIKFTLFNLSTLSLFIWFIIPYLYLPEYMKNYGYETGDSAQLISAIGIAQTIGMIGLGYVGDRPWMNVNVCYSGCMILCGLSVLLMPLLVQIYTGILFMCILFGFTFASSFSFTPSILVSIVDLDDFTCAYGLVLLVQGIGMIAGPPIAGAIYELTLRWDNTFYFAGIFIALSGVFSYLIEFCDKRKESENAGSDVNELKKAQLIH